MSPQLHISDAWLAGSKGGTVGTGPANGAGGGVNTNPQLGTGKPTTTTTGGKGPVTGSFGQPKGGDPTVAGMLLQLLCTGSSVGTSMLQ